MNANAQHPARLFLPLLLITALLAGCGGSGGSSEAAEHVNRSNTYLEQGQYRSAMLEVRNAIQEEPNEVAHFVALAEIYNEIGSGSQSEELLEPWLEDERQAVSLPLTKAYLLQNKHLSARETLDAFEAEGDEQQLKARLYRADATRRARNLDEANEQFSALREEHPDNQQVLIGLAQTLIGQQRVQQARDHLETWTEENGEDPEVLFYTGLTYYADNELDQASDILTTAASSIPETDFFLPLRRQTLTLLARVLTEQGQTTEAQVYNRILSENTDNDSRQRAEEALEAIRQGDLGTAREMLEELAEANPDNPRFNMMLGTLDVQEGNMESGSERLTANIDAETTPTPFLRAAAMAQLDTGEREEALETISRALEARPEDVELLAMHGILALSDPDHAEEGVTSLSKALRLDDSRTRLRLALARHYQQNDRSEQALAQLRMAFGQAPDDWASTSYYLDLLFSAGNDTEAEEVRDSLRNAYPDDRQSRLLANLTDARLGNTDSAIENLEALTADEPEWQPAFLALGSAYREADRTDEAIESMLEAARLTPESIGPLQQAGRLYAQDHSPDEVVIWLQDVAERHSELSASANGLAAQILVRQSNLADARSTLEGLPEDNPFIRAVTADLLAAEAEQAATEENFSQARSKSAEAIALFPDNLNLALLPVRYTALEGNIDEALSTLDEVETTFGEQPAIVRARGQLLMRAERPEEAITALEDYYEASDNPAVLSDLIQISRQEAPDRMDELTGEWVERQPTNPAAHLTRADFLMNQGNEEQAQVHYDQVLEVQPDNVGALNNLAWLLRENDRQRALELAQRAAGLAPNSGAVQDTYGWILHLDGQHEKAVELIERALELAPDNEEIEDHLEQARQAL